MDCNVVGLVGLALFVSGGVGLLLAGLGSDDPEAWIIPALLVGGIGFILILSAAAMHNSARASKCEEVGGVYLRKEQACITPDFFERR